MLPQYNTQSYGPYQDYYENYYSRCYPSYRTAFPSYPNNYLHSNYYESNNQQPSALLTTTEHGRPVFPIDGRSSYQHQSNSQTSADYSLNYQQPVDYHKNTNNSNGSTTTNGNSFQQQSSLIPSEKTQQHNSNQRKTIDALSIIGKPSQTLNSNFLLSSKPLINGNLQNNRHYTPDQLSSLSNNVEAALENNVQDYSLGTISLKNYSENNFGVNSCNLNINQHSFNNNNANNIIKRETCDITEKSENEENRNNLPLFSKITSGNNFPISKNKENNNSQSLDEVQQVLDAASTSLNIEELSEENPISNYVVSEENNDKSNKSRNKEEKEKTKFDLKDIKNCIKREVIDYYEDEYQSKCEEDSEIESNTDSNFKPKIRMKFFRKCKRKSLRLAKIKKEVDEDPPELQNLEFPEDGEKMEIEPDVYLDDFPGLPFHLSADKRKYLINFIQEVQNYVDTSNAKKVYKCPKCKFSCKKQPTYLKHFISKHLNKNKGKTRKKKDKEAISSAMEDENEKIKKKSRKRKERLKCSKCKYTAVSQVNKIA